MSAVPEDVARALLEARDARNATVAAADNARAVYVAVLRAATSAHGSRSVAELLEVSRQRVEQVAAVERVAAAVFEP